MVLYRKDVIGLDSGIFMHPTTWKASGHVDSFSDPQVDCKNCKNRMRADHYLEKFGHDVDRVPLTEVNKILDELRKQKNFIVTNVVVKISLRHETLIFWVQNKLWFTDREAQNLPDEDVVYPRGETCQGIYLNYKNVIDSMRIKPPFGIAQVGKAFRNEIVVKQFIFRTREFEQMEMQYFLHPNDMDQKFEYWKEERMNWYLKVLQIPQEKLRFKKHEKLVHYAKSSI